MAQTIILKKSTVSGRRPNVSDLQPGEVAVNLADGVIYSRDTNDNVIVVGSSTTSDIREGSNLYFSNSRARSAFVAGENISINSNGLITASLQGAESPGFINSNYSRYEFTATEGQTSFSGFDNNGSSLSLTASQTEVFLNGVRLVPTVDYTANGSHVVLIEPAVEGDQLTAINIVLNTSGVSTANIAESGNLYYTDERVQSYLEGYVGNIVPAQDITYNLGSPTKRFKDLYISSNTIVLGNIAIREEAGTLGVSLVDANGIASSDITLVVSGNIFTSNVEEDTQLYFTNARVYANVLELGYATRTYVDSEIAELVDAAPQALNTLNELAQALGNDNNFSTTVLTNIGLAFDRANLASSYATSAYDQANAKANVADLTTANVVELNNLYFTNARSVSALTGGNRILIESNGLISANISGISGAVSSVNGEIGNVLLTTANIGEQDNLYFTNARAVGALVAGDNIVISSNGLITSTAISTDDNIKYFVGISVSDTFVSDGQNLSFNTSGNILSNSQAFVFVNGVIQNPGTHYRVSGNSVVFFEPPESNSIIFVRTFDASNVELTSANITELNNLYFTNARVYSNVLELGYSTNAYVNVRLETKANVVDLNTSNIAEGTNLYYTNSRVYANVLDLGYATTAYVDNEIAQLVDTAPSALDTLNELAQALGNDNNFATTTVTLIGNSYNQGNLAYNQANAAVTYAISAFAAGNATVQLVNALYNQTNTKANVADLTTSNVVEGSNLFYTDTRVDERVSPIFNQSNTNSTLIGVVYNQANSATSYSTSAFDSGNATAILVGVVYNQSNNKANLYDLTTANVAEVNNLYFTNARVYSNVVELGYATNAYVNARLDTKANVSNLNTSNVVEGANLYYTDARVYANVEQIGYAYNTYVNSRLTTKANVSDLTTANVVELNNLYFTNARVYSNVLELNYATNAYVNARLDTKANVADLDTSNVVEGNNLYFTNARVYSNVLELNYATNAFVNTKANVSDLTTANVIEINNLYFTNARVYSNVLELGYSTNAYVNSRLDIKSNVADLTTANVTEYTNLYYTDARVYANVSQIGYATTGHVSSEIANLISSAPSTLDTLNELAAALGDDPNFATTTATLIGNGYNQGNAAYAQANIATTDARSAFAAGNTTISLVGIVYNQANAAATYATSAFDAGNTTATLVGLVYDQTNTKANAADLTTANVVEDTNLYFTNSRAISAFTAGGNIIIDANGLITANIVGGGGGTGAVSSVNGKIGNVVLVTANINEDTNLYFTNTRAVSAFTSGQNIHIASNGLITSTATGGGGSVNYSGNVYTTVGELKTLVYVGDNTTTTFNMPVAVNSSNAIFVFVNSILQEPDSSYSVTANVITFTSAPESNSDILIKYFDQTDVFERRYFVGTPTVQLYTANGNQSSFSFTSNLANQSQAFVFVDGVAQQPNVNYTQTNNIIDFESNLPANSIVLIRHFDTTNIEISTANILENGNLYFTNTRAVSAITNVPLSLTSTLTTSNTNSLGFFAERTNIISSAFTSTNQYSINDGVVHYHTTNASANGNVVLNGFVSVPVGNTASMVVLVTNGNTAYVVTNVQIDNQTSNVSVKWSGGSAPTSGNASNIDVYSFNVIKTAVGSYTVLASQSNFG